MVHPNTLVWRRAGGSVGWGLSTSPSLRAPALVFQTHRVRPVYNTYTTILISQIFISAHMAAAGLQTLIYCSGWPATQSSPIANYFVLQKKEQYVVYSEYFNLE